MSRALLDLNVLTALLWPAHEHHDAAHRWFGHRSKTGWATCGLTQLGFVRIVSNPVFSRDALSPADAVALLAQNLAHPAHEFWPDDLQVPAAVGMLRRTLEGHRQVTDAYLLALASHRQGVLATFDRGLGALADDAVRGALELVPTR